MVFERYEKFLGFVTNLLKNCLNLSFLNFQERPVLIKIYLIVDIFLFLLYLSTIRLNTGWATIVIIVGHTLVSALWLYLFAVVFFALKDIQNSLLQRQNPAVSMPEPENEHETAKSIPVKF